MRQFLQTVLQKPSDNEHDKPSRNSPSPIGRGRWVSSDCCKHPANDQQKADSFPSSSSTSSFHWLCRNRRTTTRAGNGFTRHLALAFTALN